jgi:hypothetical protein
LEENICTVFRSVEVRQYEEEKKNLLFFCLLMRANYAQIPISSVFRQQEIPSLGSVFNRQDYEGPRTTSASIAVAKHIRSFYRLFGTIGFILIISTFHIIAILFGHVKRDACPDAEMIPKMIMIFGIIDLSICGIIIIIVRFFFLGLRDH